MTISVLLTCHNRKAKTKACLLSLRDAFFTYNREADDKLCIEIFLTDDGCTDGTAEAAREIFPDENELHILKGDGNLFWAGGMRFCWREAMKRHTEWDYYLLLNDDVELLPNVFYELFCAEKYAFEEFGKEGIISGITCATDNPTKLTYGGDLWKNKFLFTLHHLAPKGEPQLCDKTNANILLVPQNIVDNVGIFYDGYIHGWADSDYSTMVRKAGFPVVLTAHFCGKCDNDHLDWNAKAKKLMGMTLKERKKFFSNPVNSDKDYLKFVWRIAPIRVPFVWFGRKLNIYFPKLYYRISGIVR